ncbi:hypothetical protein ETB97_007510 [Aspergillus alliaceus]|uniref:Uncharacterized protein n=1 Tax=Petromyces alliaceus TaxID=209559 RepID=A0A8H5ZWF8_PETAA|nr:hypothetical protein ETB97_007510 [Aspergillus burnettii]
MCDLALPDLGADKLVWFSTDDSHGEPSILLRESQSQNAIHAVGAEKPCGRVLAIHPRGTAANKELNTDASLRTHV